MKEKQERFLAERDARRLELAEKQKETIEKDTSSSISAPAPAEKAIDTPPTEDTSTYHIAISEHHDIPSSASSVTAATPTITPRDNPDAETISYTLSDNEPINFPDLPAAHDHTHIHTPAPIETPVAPGSAVHLGEPDSDADSFHTAEEEDEENENENENEPGEATGAEIRQVNEGDEDKTEREDDAGQEKSNSASLQLGPPSSSTVNDDVDNDSDSDFIARFESQKSAANSTFETGVSSKAPKEHGARGEEHIESAVEPHATQSDAQQPSLHTTIPIISMDETPPVAPPTHRISPADNTSQPDEPSSWTSENLEELALERRRQNGYRRRPTAATSDAAGPSSRTQLAKLRQANRDLDLMEENRIGRDVVECSDCHAWRRKVVQLEETVEELSSALAAKDMDLAMTRAKLGDIRRNTPKSEARLLQECESLRVTTEFLVCSPILFILLVF